MRTTLNLDDALVRAAKQRARAEGTTLTALVQRGLREVLSPVPAGPAAAVSLPTYGSTTGRPVSTQEIKAVLDEEPGAAV